MTPLGRFMRYVVGGTARFVILVRQELGRAELDSQGFYLCQGCGYAHLRGSRCSELVAREINERLREQQREPEKRAS